MPRSHILTTQLPAQAFKLLAHVHSLSRRNAFLCILDNRKQEISASASSVYVQLFLQLVNCHVMHLLLCYHGIRHICVVCYIHMIKLA